MVTETTGMHDAITRIREKLMRMMFYSPAFNRHFTAVLISAVLLSVLSLSARDALALGGDLLLPFPVLDGGAGRQEAAAMAVDRTSGAVAVTGYSNLVGDVNDNYYTVLLKPDGSGSSWPAPMTVDQAGGSDRGTAVSFDTQGNIVVTGYVTDNGKRDILTVKYDKSDGHELWRARYGGGAGGHDMPVALAVDDRDNVYVAGSSQNSSGNNDYIILKYSSAGPNGDGSPIWSERYNGDANGADEVTSLAVNAGSVAVTGFSWNGADFDICTIKYNEEGSMIWSKRISSPDSQPDWGKSIAIDSAGAVVVSGYLTATIPEVQKNIYTVKYRDPVSGDQPDVVWEAVYSSNFDDEPTALKLYGTAVLVVGYTTTITGSRDLLILKYTDPASGSIPVTPWTQTYNSGIGGNDEALGLSFDSVGNIYLTGTSSFEISNTLVLKVKQSDGTIFWHKLYENPTGKNNRPVGIGISGADEIFVAGSQELATSFDIDYYLFKHDPGMVNPPTGLVVTENSLIKQEDGSYSLTLSWQDASDNEEWFILEKKAGNNQFQEILLPANSTTYNDSGLTEWTRYTYRVKARNTLNGDSHYSNEVQELALIVAAMPPVWSFVYNGFFDSDDYATAIAAGSDNHPVVTGATIDFAPGYTSGTYSTDYLTIKLDRASSGPAAGAGLGILWKDQFEGGFNQEDDARGVAVDSGNKAIVTGNSLQDVGGPDNVNSIITRKYASNGSSVLWQSQFNGPAAIDDRVKAIAAAADGSDSTVVIGHGRNNALPAASEDIYVIKYAASPSVDEMGNALAEWSMSPVDLYGGNDYPSAVLFDKEGNVIVAGYGEVSLESSTYRTYVAKICGKAGLTSCGSTLPGQIIWSHIRTDIPFDNRAKSLTVDDDGTIYVAGFTVTSDSNRDLLVAKYAAEPRTPETQVLWTRTYRSPGYLAGDDEAIGIRYDGIDHRVVVAGNSDVALNDSDIVLISYDAATGDEKWIKSVPSAGYDEVANDMAIDLSGNIFVVGSSTGPDLNTDSLTVKFDYDGTLMGRTIYDLVGKIDEAIAATTNNLGELFVAGYATNNSTGISGNNADYLVYKVSGTSLQAPNPVTLAEHYTSAILSWKDNAANESGYTVERKNGLCPEDVRTDDPLNPWQAVNGSPLPANAVGYTDSGLTIGNHYCYRLRAFAANGETTRWVPRAADMSTPPPPADFAAIPVTTTSIALSWSDATTIEEGYFIERCTGSSCTFDSGSPDYRAITAPENSTSLTDTDVCAGTVYKYRIQAFHTNEWRTAFTELASPVSPLPWQKPAGLSGVALNEGQIQLSWTRQSTDESGYKIWRCTDAGSACSDFGSSPVVTVSGGVSSFIDNSFAPDSTVRYRVAAFKTSPVCSWETDLSDPSEGILTASSQPVLSSAGVTSTSVSLAWSDSTGTETGFRLERCLMTSCGSDTDFTTLITSGYGAVSYTDAGVCQGTAYGYRVRPINEGLSQNGGGVWQYRLPVTVTNFAPDKLLKLQVPYTAGMATDFKDIRFYDALGKVELSHWIESKTDGNSATVWLKLGANSSISMYYGNPSAVNSSNRNGVWGSGLVGFWPFNEAAGTTTGTLADLSGNALNATIGYIYSGGGIVSGGRIGNGFNMNSYQHVSVTDTDNSKLDLTGSLSLEAWYQYQPSNSWARVLSKPTVNGVQPWDLYHFYLDDTVGAQKILFRVSQNNAMPSSEFGVASPEGLVPGNWYHLVGRYDVAAKKISLFVNGIEYSNPADPPFTLASNNESLFIGSARNGGSPAAGVLDEVRIYSRALTNAEVSSRYSAEIPAATLGAAAESGPFTLQGWIGRTSSPEPVLQVTTTQLAPPSALAVTYVSESVLDVSWQYPANGEQSGFAVDRCADALCAAILVTNEVGASVRTYRDSGLTHNTTYYYRVRSVKNSSCRAESANLTPMGAETTLKAPLVNGTLPIAITTDCSDIRLLDSDGVTPLPFFLEFCNTPQTTLWTKFSSLTNGTRNLSLYYGNPTASSAAAGQGTIFTLFEDFNGTAVNSSLWSMDNSSGWTVANGLLYGSNSYGRITAKSAFVAGYAHDAKAKTITRASHGQMMAGIYSGYNGTNAGILDLGGSVHYDKGNSWYGFGSEIPLNKDMLYQVGVKNGETINLRAVDYSTGALFANSGDVSYAVSATGKISIGNRYDNLYGGEGYNAVWDWIRVRRYLDPAPTITPGAEEFGTFAALPGWKIRRSIAVQNSSAFSYTPPDGVQLAVTVDTTPLAVDQASLSWTDSTSSEDGFSIERCLGTSTNCTEGSFAVERTFSAPAANETGSVVTYLDRQIEKATDYCYRVKGVKATGWLATPSSAIVCGRTADPPSPPVVSGIGYETRIDLSWTAASTVGENGFEIERCTIISPATDCNLDTERDPGFPHLVGPNAVSYSDTSAFGNYKYRVRSYKLGASVWSGWSNEVPVATIQINRPTGMTATVHNDTSIKLTWLDTTGDESGFEVWRCNGIDCDFSLSTALSFGSAAGSGTTVTQYDTAGLLPGTVYRYQVRAVKSGSVFGWPTAFSDPTGNLTFTVSPPIGLYGSADSTTQATLKWTDTTSQETGFRMERCLMADRFTPCSDFAFVGSATGSNTTTYVDSGVCASSTYRYRVGAESNGSFMSQSGGGCWSKRMRLQISDFKSGFITRISIPKNSDMKADFSDLRFFDTAANAELSYWIETYDASNVTLWLKLGSNNSIYLYFGNTSALSVSSLTSVFGSALKAYWPFNQAAGTITGTLNDVSGSTNNNPTMNNFALPHGIVAGGRFGNALSLDGVNDFANKPSNLDFPSGSIVSVEAWVYPRAFEYDYNALVAFGNRYTATGFGASFGTNGKPSLPTWNNDFISTGDAAPLNQWSHVVYVLNGKDVSVYVNGVKSSGILTTTPSLASRYLSIGTLELYGGGRYFNGLIDELRMYATALTDTDVAARYAATPPIIAMGGVEGSGVCLNQYVGTPSVPAYVATKTPGNMLNDTEFENTTNGWGMSGWAGNYFLPLYDTSVYFSGNRSLRLNITSGQTSVGAYQQVSQKVVPGQTYLLSGYIKSSLNAGGTAFCDIYGNDIDTPGFSVSGTNDWRWLQETFTVPANVTTVYARCHIAGTTPVGSAWFDMVQLAPYSPQISAVRVSEGSVRISWRDEQTEESGYRLQRCDWADGATSCTSFATIADTLIPNSSEYIDSAVAAGRTYSYRLQAFKNASCGWSTPWSNESVVTTTITAPAALSASALDSTRIKLSWTTDAATETGYRISRSSSTDGGANWSAMAELPSIPPPASTTFIDDTVCPNVTYRYQVASFKNGLSQGNGSCWTRRKDITISNFQQAFQVKLSVARDSDMKSDYSDLRFYDPQLGVELNYWLEKADAVSATLWLKTGTSSTVEMYYGNPEAAAVGSPWRVFELYDDFAGTTVSSERWQLSDPYYGNTSLVQQNGEFVRTSPPVQTSSKIILYSKQKFQRPFVFEVNGLMQPTPTGVNAYDSYLGILDSGTGYEAADYMYGIGRSSAAPPRISIREDNVTRTIPALYTAYETWFTYRLTALSVGAVYAYGQNEPLTSIYSGTYGTENPLRVGFLMDHRPQRYDSIRVRRYAAVEPAAAFGEEVQLGSCPTFGGNWTSPQSALSPQVTTSMPQPPVLSSVAAYSDTRIDLSWNPVNTDQTGFKVERCQTATETCVPGTTDLTAPGSSSTYSDISVSGSTRYCYRIAAYKTAFCSTGWESAISNTQCAATMAATATALTASPLNSRTVKLQWIDQALDEEGYEIQIRIGRAVSNANPADEGLWVSLASIAPDSSAYIHNQGLEPGHSYVYRVRPFRGAEKSPFTAPAYVTLPLEAESPAPGTCP